MSIKIQLTTIALATTLAFAGGAKAAPAPTLSPDSETISVRVSVADLDLRQEAGAAAAHQRIRQAAALVCGGEPPSGVLLQHELYRACRKTAAGNAIADLKTQMAALYGPEPAPKATALAANR
jgi:UrcA family protein